MYREQEGENTCWWWQHWSWVPAHGLHCPDWFCPGVKSFHQVSNTGYILFYLSQEKKCELVPVFGEIRLYWIEQMQCRWNRVKHWKKLPLRVDAVAEQLILFIYNQGYRVFFLSSSFRFVLVWSVFTETNFQLSQFGRPRDSFGRIFYSQNVNFCHPRIKIKSKLRKRYFLNVVT